MQFSESNFGYIIISHNRSGNKEGKDMTLWIILGVLVLFILYAISAYNGLVKMREMVRNAMGNIAAQVESRWDAITNLIEATKKYSEHEAGILKDLTIARANINKESKVGQVEADDNAFNSAMGRLIAVAEAYPDLKASEVYKETMRSVDKYEENVRMSRMIYNDNVTKINTRIQTFPTNIVAGIFGFSKEDYFQNTESKKDMPSW